MDIHFDCTQCGRCCHNLKLPLSIDEARRWTENGHQVQLLIEAAPAFDEPSADGPERFRFDRSFPAMSGTIPIRVSVILVAAFEGACPHLQSDMLCGNYDVRPRVCRIYPAETHPGIELVPANKACPPEAWSDNQPVFTRGGTPTDRDLALLIEGHRSATLADVEAKSDACLTLGITTAAFTNEGYAVHSPTPERLAAVLSANPLRAPATDGLTQWRFLTNRQNTLAMLQEVEASSSKVRSGADYIGFFDDDG